jgi:hypothetical protein
MGVPTAKEFDDMDEQRPDLNSPADDSLEQAEGAGAGQPTETDPRLPPQGSSGVADEGEDRGFGEQPAGSEDATPRSEFEPRPTDDGPQEGDQGVGSGGD